jgi:hypothetical protein
MMQRRHWRSILFLGIILALGPAGFAPAADLKPLLTTIKAVGEKGKGNAEAARAWRQLARSGPDGLIDVLTAMNDANPVAANWLRSAVETIVDRTLNSGKKLPASRLEAFVLNTRNAGPVRRLAYECLLRVDSSAKRLIPKMLNDPSAELRRDAVELFLLQAEALARVKEKEAVVAFKLALVAARDRDQIERIAKRLKTLGVSVDLTAQFGFITQWKLIGPFDNTRGVGFATVYPPEKQVVLTAVHQGKKEKQMRWLSHQTKLDRGLVDLNIALGKNMGATAYAFAVVTSSAQRPVQLRASSNNAIKIFLNGKLVFSREEYHHGTRMDQHVGSGVLKAGRNEILVKICQNEQTDSWAQSWSFQLRVCDAIGGPVPIKLVTEGNNETGKQEDKKTRRQGDKEKP